MYRCTSRGRLNRPLVAGLREEESSNRSFHSLLQQQSPRACNCKHWTLFSDFLPLFIISPSLDPFRYRGHSTPFIFLFFFFFFFPNGPFVESGYLSRSSSIYDKCFDQKRVILIFAILWILESIYFLKIVIYLLDLGIEISFLPPLEFSFHLNSTVIASIKVTRNKLRPLAYTSRHRLRSISPTRLNFSINIQQRPERGPADTYVTSTVAG